MRTCVTPRFGTEPISAVFSSSSARSAYSAGVYPTERQKGARGARAAQSTESASGVSARVAAREASKQRARGRAMLLLECVYD